LKSALAAFRPDTVVHLAFIVNPLHNEVLMRDINLNGSRNVFDAADTIGVKRLLVASSATALGAWPDNPVPLDDRAPVRGRTEFSYSADKVQLELMLSEFEELHPQMAVSWIRPCIIYGPGVDNYLSRLLLKHPLVVFPDGCDLPQQFVHEDDVAAATWWILARDGRGPYNVAPPDWIHLSDVARESGRRTISIPFWMMKFASRVCWNFRLPFLRYPPGVNFYIRYSWIVAPRRLGDELGFRFRYTSLETLRDLLRSHGKLVTHPQHDILHSGRFQAAPSPGRERRRSA
jgi:UDP-glucose 4-epimerase